MVCISSNACVHTCTLVYLLISYSSFLTSSPHLPHLSFQFNYKILVEYDSAQVDRFIEFADSLEDAIPGVMVDGTETTDTKSTFNVKLEDGELLLSVSADDDLPDTKDVLDALTSVGFSLTRY